MQYRASALSPPFADQRIKGSSPSLKRREPHGIKVPRLSLRINLNQRRGTHERDYYRRRGPGKGVIVVCAGDAQGRTVYFKQFSFAGFAEWAAKLSACTFGMEACSTAHHWARFLSAHGHPPKLMAAEFVGPFRKSRSTKNDRNDAQAILAAVRQPDMRFVSVKSVDQQAMLAWHRARAGFSEERKALLNRTRGLLAQTGKAPHGSQWQLVAV